MALCPTSARQPCSPFSRLFSCDWLRMTQRSSQIFQRRSAVGKGFISKVPFRASMTTVRYIWRTEWTLSWSYCTREKPSERLSMTAKVGFR